MVLELIEELEPEFEQALVLVLGTAKMYTSLLHSRVAVGHLAVDTVNCSLGMLVHS